MPFSEDREEQLVLLLALQILADLGQTRPKKRNVLAFIRNRKFAKSKDHDFDARAKGESVWENDFSWARADLKSQKRLDMPEIGVWRITDAGKAVLRERAKAWLDKFTEDPSSKDRFLTQSSRITPTSFDTMIAFARGEDVTRITKET
jgi:hypothetical protein